MGDTVAGVEYAGVIWRVFEREAVRRYVEREYDEILLSQVSPENYQNFDGTVRPSILRALGRPVTVPIENVICVTQEEAERVDRFVRDGRIAEFEHRILFECSSRSGQSFITPDLAQEIAARLYRALPNTTVIYTTSEPMQLRDERSRYAGSLSLREIAHLTHACSVFVGAGSGCTVLATSSAAKQLPSVLLLRGDTSMFASFAQDLDYFGIDHPGIVELTDENPNRIAACIALVSLQGTGPAFGEYGGHVRIAFDHYRRAIGTYLLQQQRYPRCRTFAPDHSRPIWLDLGIDRLWRRHDCSKLDTRSALVFPRQAAARGDVPGDVSGGGQAPRARAPL